MDEFRLPSATPANSPAGCDVVSFKAFRRRWCGRSTHHRKPPLCSYSSRSVTTPPHACAGSSTRWSSAPGTACSASSAPFPCESCTYVRRPLIHHHALPPTARRRTPRPRLRARNSLGLGLFVVPTAPAASGTGRRTRGSSVAVLKMHMHAVMHGACSVLRHPARQSPLDRAAAGRARPNGCGWLVFEPAHERFQFD
uniref:Uncharacterized protein n=1 Tax=Leersia perrieri TaxID=77586 RepID=A0A0D9VUH2_9ORYZ